MDFVDRQEELDWLQEGWESGKPQLRILYVWAETGR
jgi:AAA+ ATPase superfamily predicted ATPase